MPFILPHVPDLAATYARRCDAIVLTGGDDPATEGYGVPTDPRARLIDPARQAFECALLAAAAEQPDMPVLGICLGMQLMALEAGGRLDQYLPDHLATAAEHQDDRRHGLVLHEADSPLNRLLDGDGTVQDRSGGAAITIVSSHRQAVGNPGRLRIIATAPDGVVEAIDDPTRRFYLGVQWHPERGGAEPLSRGLIAALVAAARSTSSARPRR